MYPWDTTYPPIASRWARDFPAFAPALKRFFFEALYALARDCCWSTSAIRGMGRGRRSDASLGRSSAAIQFQPLLSIRQLLPSPPIYTIRHSVKTHARTHTNTHAHTHIHTHTHAHTLTHARTHARAHTHTHTSHILQGAEKKATTTTTTAATTAEWHCMASNSGIAQSEVT